MENIDEISKEILSACSISFSTQNEILIEREILLNHAMYEKLLPKLLDLRKVLSSSSLTSLQENANKKHKWPLLNLVRQILTVYGYNMIPIRKCDGYTLDGVKKFKRYFQIIKKDTSLKMK